MKPLYSWRAACNSYKYTLCLKNRVTDLAQKGCYSNKCQRLHSLCKRRAAIHAAAGDPSPWPMEPLPVVWGEPAGHRELALLLSGWQKTLKDVCKKLLPFCFSAVVAVVTELLGSHKKQKGRISMSSCVSIAGWKIWGIVYFQATFVYTDEISLSNTGIPHWNCCVFLLGNSSFLISSL